MFVLEKEGMREFPKRTCARAAGGTGPYLRPSRGASRPCG